MIVMTPRHPRSIPSPRACRRLAGALVGLAAATAVSVGCSRKQPPTREATATPAPMGANARTEPPARPGATYSEAAWRAKEAAVRAQLGPGFTLVRSHPFLVAGDEAPDEVRAHAERTVAWATRLLKKQYFPKDPPQLLTVYLFRDRQSYERHVQKLWGHAPSTPYGYYSETEAALVMNIATGGGTLVHEMVHPFMAANFPEVPSWLNEGMGSLYEQCQGKDGEIRGLTNWRLAGLQKVIRNGRLPSFKTLLSTTSAEFYGEGSGTHYAQARYLCYYLQERGLLGKFYRAFHAAAHAKDGAVRDATGYATLRRILGSEGADMDAFERQWKAWALTLTFP